MRHIGQARSDESQVQGVSRLPGAPDMRHNGGIPSHGDVTRNVVAQQQAINVGGAPVFAGKRPPLKAAHLAAGQAVTPRHFAMGSALAAPHPAAPPRARIAAHSGTTHASVAGDVHPGATHAKQPASKQVVRGATGFKAPSRVHQKDIDAAAGKAPKLPRGDRFGVTAMAKAAGKPMSGPRFRGAA